MKVRASIVKDDITIDHAEIAPSMVRHWAHGREGDYILYVNDGIRTTVSRYVNGRKKMVRQ